VAEIRVERKRRSLLPYLLALLVLVALLWWFLSRDAAPETAAAAAADTAAVAAAAGTLTPGATADSAAGAVAPAAGAATANSAVNDFIAFVEPSTVERNEDEQHRYTADGLRRLAAALESLKPGGAAGAQLALVRQKADSLQTTAAADDRHTEMARAAFDAADEVMAALPNARAISSQVDAARRAAREVNPGEHLLEQRSQVQAYFDAATAALRAAAGPA